MDGAREPAQLHFSTNVLCVKEPSMPAGSLVPNHMFVMVLLLALIEVLKLALHDPSSCNDDTFHK